MSKAYVKYFDFIDRNLFKGYWRRGFKNYAYEGSHKRQAGKIMLTRTARVCRKLLKERFVRKEEFIKPVEKPLFIGSITGRSGTTWLQDIFREYVKNHVVVREIGVFMLGQFREAPYEYFQSANFPNRRSQYIKYFRKFILTNAYSRSSKMMGTPGLNGLSDLLPVRGLKKALNEMEKRLRRAKKYEQIRQIFGDFYLWLFNYHACIVNKGKPWISKEPPYARHADQLFAMIPNARLLVMARDGRDSAISMHTGGWHPDLQTAVDRWQYFTAMTLQALKKCPKRQHLIIRYEDLVTNFEERLQRIFEFFELNKADIDAILRDPLLKPTSAAIGKWKKQMSDTEKEYFKDTCSDLMTELGYEI